MKEAYLNIVESPFSEKVVPRHIELLDQDEKRADSAVDYNEEEVAEMTAVVNRIVQSCSVDPEKVLLNLVLVYYILLDNMSNAITYTLLERKIMYK